MRRVGCVRSSYGRKSAAISAERGMVAAYLNCRFGDGERGDAGLVKRDAEARPVGQRDAPADALAGVLGATHVGRHEIAGPELLRALDLRRAPRRDADWPTVPIDRLSRQAVHRELACPWASVTAASIR